MEKVQKFKKKSRLQLLHQYYVYTGFYSFLKIILKKSLLPITIFIGVLLGIHFFVMDINSILEMMIDTFPTAGILTVFLI